MFKATLESHSLLSRAYEVFKMYLWLMPFSLQPSSPSKFWLTTTCRCPTIIKFVHRSIYVLHHRIGYEERWLSSSPRTWRFQLYSLLGSPLHLSPHDDHVRQPRQPMKLETQRRTHGVGKHRTKSKANAELKRRKKHMHFINLSRKVDMETLNNEVGP